MKTLLEDYKRRLATVNELIENTPNNGGYNDSIRAERFKTKAECYRTLISELEREIKETPIKENPSITKGAWKTTAFSPQKSNEFMLDDRTYSVFIDAHAESIKPALVFGFTKEDVNANAERIVKAVNCHDELRKSLFEIKTLYMNSPIEEYLQPYKEAWVNVNEVLDKSDK